MGPLASTRSKFYVCAVDTHGYGGVKGIETSEHVSFAAFVKKPSARITNVRQEKDKSAAPNENIIQNQLNIALLNVFLSPSKRFRCILRNVCLT